MASGTSTHEFIDHGNQCLTNTSVGIKHGKNKPYKKNRTMHFKNHLNSKTFKSIPNEFKSKEKTPIGPPNLSMFLIASDAFEGALAHLTEADNDEQVYKRLLQIQDKIKNKIRSFKALIEGEVPQNLIISKSVASSQQSLCSETSVVKLFDEKDASFIEFMSRVNCPFCSKPEPDKITLIKHLDETCKRVMLNVFEEKIHVDFAAFQILPNGTFKCNICLTSNLTNLKELFAHVQWESHKSAYTLASKSKNYTEFLFCSCCKILVPNNYTQLHQHINHLVHKERNKVAPMKLSSYSKRGISCVYIKSKKFKCINCTSQSLHKNPRDILEHFGNLRHATQTSSKVIENIIVFCEFCFEKIHIYEVLSHFTSEKHKILEKASEEIYEMCIYCDFTCHSLTDLSLHMKSQCQEINNIRAQNQTKEARKAEGEPNVNESDNIQTQNKIKREPNVNESDNIQTQNKIKREPNVNESEKVQSPNRTVYGKKEVEKKTKHKSTDKEKIKGDKTKEGPHIIVKGTTKLPELYKYFKEFGEITELEIIKGEEVLIQFQDRCAVEDILLLRGLIKIAGKKIEVSSDETLINSSKEEEKKQPEGSKVTTKSGNEGASLNDAIKSENRGNDLKPIKYDSNISQLFTRVSHHLLQSTEKCDDDMLCKIRNDCIKVFGPQDYPVIGFTASGLAFPVENISLYIRNPCGALNNLQSPSSLLDTGRFQNLENLSKKFLDAPEWQEVVCKGDGGFPYIECKHKETQKACTFMVMGVTKFLTDILRKSMTGYAQNFCILLRFWLAVHELKIREFEYVIISLLIFFLTSDDRNSWTLGGEPGRTCNAGKFYQELRNEIGSHEVTTSWRGSLSNEKELFTEFLYFLLKFDFSKYVICLPLNRAVPKSIFRTHANTCYLFTFDYDLIANSSMCILDPQMTVNLASGVTANDLKSLLDIARRNYK